jgi:hypothetical protein
MASDAETHSKKRKRTNKDELIQSGTVHSAAEAPELQSTGDADKKKKQRTRKPKQATDNESTSNPAPELAPTENDSQDSNSNQKTNRFIVFIGLYHCFLPVPCVN